MVECHFDRELPNDHGQNSKLAGDPPDSDIRGSHENMDDDGEDNDYMGDNAGESGSSEEDISLDDEGDLEFDQEVIESSL